MIREGCSGLGHEKEPRVKECKNGAPEAGTAETDSTPDLAEDNPLYQHSGLGLLELFYDFWGVRE